MRASKLSLAFACAFVLASCSRAGQAPTSNAKSVEDVLSERMDEIDGNVQPGDLAGAEAAQPTLDDLPEEALAALASDTIDLTKMSGVGVYSTVYQMITNPRDYDGRTLIMKGAFNSYYTSGLDRRFFTVVVQDATSCCSQGIQFDWPNKVWPNDYPEVGTEVVVVGTVESYEAHGAYYLHLVDANLSYA